MPKIQMKEKVEMEKVLKEMDFGFLGLSDNDKPYVIPMSYAYQNNRIYLHASLKGLKLEYIRNNPQVCFTVADLQQIIPNDDPCNVAMRYRSVVAQGKAAILEDHAEKTTSLQILAAKYSADQDNPEIDSRKVDAVTVIVIEIEEMTGKRNVEGLD